MTTFTADVIELLETAGFSEMGGGDNFTAYAVAESSKVAVYLFDNRWELHDFEKQVDDAKPQAKGRSAASLAYLLAKK